LGENINNQGLRMKIKEYRRYSDIDVEFEDGYISYNKSYASFKKGNIKNPNNKNSQIINREGETIRNKYGSNMTIVEYINTQDITVKFDNGQILKSNYSNFKKGTIKSLYDKSICNIGYIGEGKYQCWNNKNKTKPYICWCSMFTRCYNENQRYMNPTYKDCTVAEEWHNFQNFAKWFYENYYEVDDERMDLDKDILVKGNKVYSPEACIFVPKDINSLFVNRQGDRGNYPLGISKAYKSGFVATCSIYDNNKYIIKRIGKFNSIEDAFYSGYKPFKENYIKQVADKYKDQIPKKLYDAMYNWVVEITD
jgi:hypothetical protein